MKKCTRKATALLCAAAITAAAAVPVNAAGRSCNNVRTSCGSFGNSSSNCTSFDLLDILNILKKYGINTGQNNSSNSSCTGNNCTQKPSNSVCTGNNCTQKPSNSVCTGNSCTQKPSNSSCTGNNCTQKPPANSSCAGNNCSQAPADTDDYTVSEYEKEVVRLVNEIRAENGLSALTLSTELSKVARIKAQDMRDNRYFSHNSPTYGSPFDMMKSYGITYRSAGENIASGQRNPEEVVKAWMNSAGHKANILNSSFKEIGMGYVAEGRYWVQMFIG